MDRTNEKSIVENAEAIVNSRHLDASYKERSQRFRSFWADIPMPGEPLSERDRLCFEALVFVLDQSLELPHMAQDEVRNWGVMFEGLLIELHHLDAASFKLAIGPFIDLMPETLKINHITGSLLPPETVGRSLPPRFSNHYGVLDIKQPNHTLMAYAAASNPIAFAEALRRFEDAGHSYQATDAMVDHAIRKEAHTILFLPKQYVTRDRMLEACFQSEDVVGRLYHRYPKEVDEKLILRAVKAHPMALQRLPRACHTPTVCLAAVKGDPRALRQVLLPLSNDELSAGQGKGLRDWLDVIKAGAPFDAASRKHLEETLVKRVRTMALSLDRMEDQVAIGRLAKEVNAIMAGKVTESSASRPVGDRIEVTTPSPL